MPEELRVRDMTLFNQIGCDEIVQQFISGLCEYEDSIRGNTEIQNLNETYDQLTTEEILIDDQVDN